MQPNSAAPEAKSLGHFPPGGMHRHVGARRRQRGIGPARAPTEPDRRVFAGMGEASSDAAEFCAGLVAKKGAVIRPFLRHQSNYSCSALITGPSDRARLFRSA